jgi:hypothetical protein
MEETMQQKRGQPIVSVLVILMAVVACALPGQVTQPTPTIDLSAMETAAASTAQAAATQTEQAIPDTATPRPTGLLKEEQSDGATLFSDYDGGYQITFPEGWTVVIPEEGDISEALSAIPEQEENISKLIEAARSADANNMIRGFGFNLKAQQGVYTPNINVSQNTNSLLLAASLKDLVDATVAYYPSINIEVVSSEVRETASGTEIGVIETQWAMNASGGEKIDLRQKQVMFKSEGGVVILTFSTIKETTVDLSADVDTVIESFKLLDQ